MGAYDHARAQRVAGNQIERFGSPGKLRSIADGSERDCKVAILEYGPRESQLRLEGYERALIAAPLAVPPNHETDLLVANGNVYRIVLPIRGPRPGGHAIYYEAQVLYDARA